MWSLLHRRPGAVRVSTILLVVFWIPLLANLFLPFEREVQLRVLFAVSALMLLASMALCWFEGRGPDRNPVSLPKYLMADAALLWLLAISFHDRILPTPRFDGHDLWLVVPFAVSMVLFYAYAFVVWARPAAPKRIAVASVFGVLLMAAVVFYQAAAHARPSITVALALLGMAMVTGWLSLDPPPRDELGKTMVLFAQSCAVQAVIGCLLGTPFWSLVACVFGAPFAVSGFAPSFLSPSSPSPEPLPAFPLRMRAREGPSWSPEPAAVLGSI